MHPQVGQWVALGGNAYHLTEATERLRELTAPARDTDGGRERAAGGESRVVQAFAGLLPDGDDGGGGDSHDGDGDGNRTGPDTTEGHSGHKSKPHKKS
jgi:hypothetical protein